MTRTLRSPLRLLATALVAVACAPVSARPEAALSADGERLARYLRFDTTNPPGAEQSALEWLAGELRAGGVEPELVTGAGGRTNLVARLPATVPAAPVVALLHHVDVVPAGDGWTHPAFAGEVHDGAIWGRGAIDTKSLGIAHLAAFLDAARLAERRRELLFLATSDEEAGGGEGVAHLLADRPELLDRLEAVLNEGGGNRAVGERLLYWGIETSQKRALWLEARARGRGGHASNAEAKTAVHRLLLALVRLVETPPAERASPTTREFLAGLGALDRRAARAARAVDKLGRGEALDAADRAALAGYENLLRDSLQVTTLRGSERVNVVAAEASAGIDARLLPDTDADRFLADLRARLGDDIELDVTLAAPRAVPASPTDSAFYRVVAAELAPTAPVVQLFVPSFTDSRFFRERGVPAYGFSPFAIDAVELLTVHADDERLSMTTFDHGVATMKRVVRALLSAPRGK